MGFAKPWVGAAGGGARGRAGGRGGGGGGGGRGGVAGGAGFDNLYLRPETSTDQERGPPPITSISSDSLSKGAQHRWHRQRRLFTRCSEGPPGCRLHLNDPFVVPAWSRAFPSTQGPGWNQTSCIIYVRCAFVDAL